MNLIKFIGTFVFTLIVFGCQVKSEAEAEPDGDQPTFDIYNAANITTNSAFVSGSVTGIDILDVGFVYDKISNLNELSPAISRGQNTGSIAATLTSLESNTVYYFAIYARMSSGDFLKSRIMTFKTEEGQVDLKIGDSFEGGIIYYLDNTGQHGLMASPTDINTGSGWQTAFDDCNNLFLGGNSDWRLPDLDELKELYNKKDVIGGFSPIGYWSSSISGSNSAYGVFFGSGTNAGKTFSYDKSSGALHSRAIRNF